MLALLEEIEGVAAAQVDHSGMLLRLDLVFPEEHERWLAAITARLKELGYGTNVLRGSARSDVLRSVERWYDRRSAGELSLEEEGTLRQSAPSDQDPERG